MSYEGFMGKRGGVEGKSKWRRRWFVLNGTTLSYYAKKSDPNPRGTVSLTEAYVVSSSAQSRPLCFQVVCPERTYYFEPENAPDRKKWIKAIKAALPAEAANKKKILYSGALLKLGGMNRTKWQRRFCCVLEGEIAYYLRPRFMFPPEKRQGTILLTGAVLTESHASTNALGFEIRQGDRVYTLQVPPPVHTSALRRGSAAFQFQKEEEDKLDEEEQADVQDAFRQWITTISIGIPSKVFGVPLDLAVTRSRGTNETQIVPSPLLMATQWLNQYGLASVGLYRVPGAKTEVENMILLYDTGKAVKAPADTFAPENMASLIVQFLKRCPESLFSDKYAQVFEQITVEYNMQKQIKQLVMMKKLLTMIPPYHCATIKLLCQHLLQVADHSEENNMTVPKLAMCVYTRMSTTLQLCLEHFSYLFENGKIEKESKDGGVESELTETIRRVTISCAPKFEEGDSDEEKRPNSPSMKDSSGGGGGGGDDYESD